MNTTLACVFPQTLPDADFVFPLLQVFDGVVHLQAVENEPLETDSDYLRQCLESGKLHPFAPAPLGEERQRFLALVEDMRRHGADYISQLSMLTVAGLQRSEQVESSQALVTDLLKRSDIRSREEEQVRLWQARLMLKLGECHDRQHADIATALDAITSRQQRLLHELREEDDDSFALTAEITGHSREEETMQRNRLKAWIRLALHAQDLPAALPITCHAAILDLLQEIFEKRSTTAAKPLASLPLPLLPGTAEPGVPLIEQLPELKAALKALTLPCPPEQVTALAQRLGENHDSWLALLERNYPETEHGRCQLQLVYFPGISASQLLREVCGGEQQSASSSTEPSGCCIGLLSVED